MCPSNRSSLPSNGRNARSSILPMGIGTIAAGAALAVAGLRSGLASDDFVGLLDRDFAAVWWPIGGILAAASPPRLCPALFRALDEEAACTECRPGRTAASRRPSSHLKGAQGQPGDH